MRVLLFISIFFCCLSLFSQRQVGLETVTISEDSNMKEELIEELASALLKEHPRKTKDSLNAKLKALLTNELSKEEAIKYPFSKIESISILTPKDSSFRIFNWSIPYLDGTHSYECGILSIDNSKNLKLEFMQQQDSLMSNEELSNYNGNNTSWLGGLYYEIIQKKNKFNTYYTLLTWDGNDLMTNKKHIEVLWFDQSGNIRFGFPLFTTNKEKLSRVIFEFGGQNSMRLYYNEKLDRIVFDHLSPTNSSLEGIYEYYGADFTYDAYQWKNDSWVLITEVYPEFADPKNRTEAKVKKSNTPFKPEDAINKKSVEQYKKAKSPN